MALYFYGIIWSHFPTYTYAPASLPPTTMPSLSRTISNRGSSVIFCWGLRSLASKTPVAPCGIVPAYAFFQSWHHSWKNLTPLIFEYCILLLGGMTEPEGRELMGESICLQLFSFREDGPEEGVAGRLESTAQGLGSGNQRASHPPENSNHKFVMRKLIFWQYGPQGPLVAENQKLGVCRAHLCLQVHMPQSKRDAQSHGPKHAHGNATVIEWYRHLSR